MRVSWERAAKRSDVVQAVAPEAPARPVCGPGANLVCSSAMRRARSASIRTSSTSTSARASSVNRLRRTVAEPERSRCSREPRGAADESIGRVARAILVASDRADASVARSHSRLCRSMDVRLQRGDLLPVGGPALVEGRLRDARLLRVVVAPVAAACLVCVRAGRLVAFTSGESRELGNPVLERRLVALDRCDLSGRLPDLRLVEGNCRLLRVLLFHGARLRQLIRDRRLEDELHMQMTAAHTTPSHRMCVIGTFHQPLPATAKPVTQAMARITRPCAAPVFAG